MPRYQHYLPDMSSRTAAGRKRLQQPPPNVSPPDRLDNQPGSSTSTTRADFISSTRSRTAHRIHTSVQRLDLSNLFTQPVPSQAPAPTCFPPSNHVSFRNIESNRAVEAVPSYGPTPLRVDPLGIAFL